MPETQQRFRHQTLELRLTLLVADLMILGVTVEAPTAAARRSSRVFTRIPVHTSGRRSDGRKFKEKSQTIVVNAHGALIYLQQELGLGADIVLTNPVTEEEQECRVVFLGESSERGQRIGVEFNAPAPHFWGMDFTPADWQRSTSEEEPS